MLDLSKSRALARDLDLTGDKALKFIIHPQNILREERTEECKLKKHESELEQI